MSKIVEIIQQTAEATASAVVRRQRQTCTANLYRAMERLLRSYPRLKRLVEDADGYGYLPTERSKSITFAPPPGSGMRDRTELTEEHIAERMASYERTKERFEEIDAVVRQFQDKPEFIVIRMYYFGEDANGNPRGDDAKPYTFEGISEELSYSGMERSERTLRTWRTHLVQDMTVLLFGAEGAVSIESRGMNERRTEQ